MNCTVKNMSLSIFLMFVPFFFSQKTLLKYNFFWPKYCYGLYLLQQSSVDLQSSTSVATKDCVQVKEDIFSNAKFSQLNSCRTEQEHDLLHTYVPSYKCAKLLVIQQNPLSCPVGTHPIQVHCRRFTKMSQSFQNAFGEVKGCKQCTEIHR